MSNREIRANKKMHVTLPALANFGIIARRNGLGVLSGLVLPVRALAGHVILGVSLLLVSVVG